MNQYVHLASVFMSKLYNLDINHQVKACITADDSAENRDRSETERSKLKYSRKHIEKLKSKKECGHFSLHLLAYDCHMTYTRPLPRSVLSLRTTSFTVHCMY